MGIIVNALIGILVGWLVLFIENLLTFPPHPINVIIAIIVGIIVFMGNPVNYISR